MKKILCGVVRSCRKTFSILSIELNSSTGTNPANLVIDGMGYVKYHAVRFLRGVRGPGHRGGRVRENDVYDFIHAGARIPLCCAYFCDGPRINCFARSLSNRYSLRHNDPQPPRGLLGIPQDRYPLTTSMRRVGSKTNAIPLQCSPCAGSSVFPAQNVSAKSAIIFGMFAPLEPRMLPLCGGTIG